MLFSEDFASDSGINANADDFNDLPIRTVSEFQKNVLFYGLSQKDEKKEEVCYYSHHIIFNLKCIKNNF